MGNPVNVIRSRKENTPSAVDRLKELNVGKLTDDSSLKAQVHKGCVIDPGPADFITGLGHPAWSLVVEFVDASGEVLVKRCRSASCATTWP